MSNLSYLSPVPSLAQRFIIVYTENIRKGACVMRSIYRVRGGCTLCAMCYYVCPTKAISLKPNVTAVIDAEKCIGCGQCADNCQVEAIVRVERKTDIH